MFGIIKRVFIALVVSECKVRPVMMNINNNEPLFYL